MSNLELFQLLRGIILTVTGVPEVIRSNPNAPSPSGEYCAVSMTQPARQRGQANIHYKEVDQTEGTILWKGVEHDVRPQLILEASVNFYRGRAHEYARMLFQANKRPDIQELLLAAKVGWNGSGAVNNLNALQSENWEQRAQLTIRLMFEESSKVVTNAIYKVPFEIENEEGEIIESGEVTTPVGLNYGGGYGAYEYGDNDSEYQPTEMDA